MQTQAANEESAEPSRGEVIRKPKTAYNLWVSRTTSQPRPKQSSCFLPWILVWRDNSVFILSVNLSVNMELNHGTNRYDQDVRESVKMKNPTLASRQIQSLIGQKWQKMSEERKKEYQDEAKVMIPIRQASYQQCYLYLTKFPFGSWKADLDRYKEAMATSLYKLDPSLQVEGKSMAAGQPAAAFPEVLSDDAKAARGHRTPSPRASQSAAGGGVLTVREWLANISGSAGCDLVEYAEALEREKVTVDMIPLLTLDVLEEMRVSLPTLSPYHFRITPVHLRHCIALPQSRLPVQT